MARLTAFAVLLLAACIPPIATPAAGDTGDQPALECPGLQCPCPCESPFICGPHNACTMQCSTDDQCGRLLGEHCIAGLCGVSCRPGGVDDCAAVGMAGSTCLEVQGTNVCGYA